ncbi:MAG TPA: DUF2842 domain-containing protein [Rhizobiales bacterium]|nr:DUF2842 domain-containing protein [Hyphomicrobiales bacterium]
MPLRLKKLIGTVLLVLLVILYALAATAIAVARLAESSAIVHLLFFLFSGLLWVLPAMLIVKWMAGPKAIDGGAPRR